MSFKRHLCQTKVVVFVILLDTQLASDFGGLMWQVFQVQFAAVQCSLQKQVQSLKPQFVLAQPLKPQRTSGCTSAGSKGLVGTKQ